MNYDALFSFVGGCCRDVARNVSTCKHSFQRMLSLAFFLYEFAKNTLAREKVSKNALARQKMRLSALYNAIRRDKVRYMAFIRRNDGEGLTRGLGCAYIVFNSAMSSIVNVS